MNNKGFTLIELMTAMAISSFVAIAGISLFSTTNWAYKVNEDVVEAQESGRMAMDMVAKDIRGAGFGLPAPPFSLTFAGLSATPTALPNPLTSIITVSNSSNTPDSITILGIGYQAGTLVRDAVAPSCNQSTDQYICMDSVGSANSFFSGNGPYTYQPNRQYISINGTTFIQLAGAQLDSDRAAGRLALNTAVNILDRDYPDNTPVYIIQAVNYSIDTTATGCSATNPCLAMRDYSMLRGGTTPGERVVLSENIEDLQFAYATDTDLDGRIDYDESLPYTDATAFYFSQTGPTALPASSVTGILGVRANIVAMARNRDPKSGQFNKECREDRANDAGCTGASDGFRRRVFSRLIKIRNLKNTL